MKVSTEQRKSEPPARINDSPEIVHVVKPAVDESRPSNSSKKPSIVKEEAFFEEDWIPTRKANVRVYPEDSAGVPFVDSPHLVSSFSDDEFESTYESTKSLFEKAYQYVKPSPFFRFVVYLYAERKLLVVFWIHFVSTMVIWAHFALIKFDEQKANVPEGAPHYWWKRIAPPLEFGSMHAILFQMALIPLTMARFSIAALSESVVDRFVPLNRTVRIHIHLGYTMVFIVFLATVFFFVFFGVLCAGGEEEFCSKFTSEIMCTGYGILASLLIIGGTSYFRHRIPYELFYSIHHLVFVLYAITIAHTFDNAQRNGERNRSQTFKWFSATLLYYICDRAAMHLNHKYRARLVASSAVTGNNGSRMIILKLQRPALFQFKPGQYAYLKISEIDEHWHPFSIASEPASSYIEFYIEVLSDKSWTGKLWTMLANDGEGGFSQRIIEFEIMGPYGTSLAKMEDFSHAIAIGTGTGIVPILSLFKQHVRQLMRLSPEKHFKELEEHQQKVLEVEAAEECRKGSIAKQVVRSCQSRGEYTELSHQTRDDCVKETIRSSITRCDDLDLDKGTRAYQLTVKEIKRAAFKATRSIYGVVILSTLPVIGIALLALTISWNTVPIELYEGMVEALKVLTVVFQFCFAIVALFVWNGKQLFAYVDSAICLVVPFADLFWFRYQYDINGVLRPVDIVTFSLLTIYMVARLWNMTVKPRHRSWRTGAGGDGARTMERLEVVWVSRSASLVSEILPDINEVWEDLVHTWGKEDAHRVCRFSVYVTEQDTRALEAFKRDVHNTSLYKSGFIRFGRPEFGRIIEDHTLELVTTRRNSYSLLSFCGSPKLAQELHHCKISNDMVTAIAGYKKHQMEFISESYGGIKSRKKQVSSLSRDDTDSESLDGADEKQEVLTWRRTTSYGRSPFRFGKERLKGILRTGRYD